MNKNVEIVLRTNDVNSDEYQASVLLRQMLLESLPKEALGKITILSNVTLLGQRVKDMDLLVFGELSNCKVRAVFNDEEDTDSAHTVKVHSFCLTIELKSHSVTGVFRRGTEIYVRYNDRWHSATSQSNAQKYAVKNYLVSRLGAAPFINNLIWFNAITPAEIADLLDDEGYHVKSNLLPTYFSFSDLIQLICYQQPPYRYGGEFRINNLYQSNLPADEIARCFNFFTEAKAAMGELTRQKIEALTSKAVSQDEVETGQMIVYRGRAGTGKTYHLLRQAIDGAVKEDKRVLLLTYNNALVSDIRRLLAFAEIPDDFDGRSVSVSTVHKFFFRFMHKLGLISKNDDTFLERYDTLVHDLWLLISSGAVTRDDINKAIGADYGGLAWDRLLVDEGQDWSESERNVLVFVYGHHNISVGAGVDQLIRSHAACDWPQGLARTNKRLRVSLRQKSNLVTFINNFARESGMEQFSLAAAKSLVGGEVIVTVRDYLACGLHETELAKLLEAGNCSYDYLFLTPPQLVTQTEVAGEKVRAFAKRVEYSAQRINLWDGTRPDLRLEYPIELSQHRLLQYDSCRGIEGWTVVCLEFDRFISYKEQSFDPDLHADPLRLETLEVQRRRFVNSWALLPLTRAINTLIITLADPSAPVAGVLRNLHERAPDYIRWVN